MRVNIEIQSCIAAITLQAHTFGFGNKKSGPGELVHENHKITFAVVFKSRKTHPHELVHENLKVSLQRPLPVLHTRCSSKVKRFDAADGSSHTHKTTYMLHPPFFCSKKINHACMWKKFHTKADLKRWKV